MLVVCGIALIAGLALLSIPGFKRTEHRIAREECVRTLAMIEAAKVFYASDNDLKPGAPVTFEQIADHYAEFSKGARFPVLPQGASDLQIGVIGTQPTCLFRGERIYPMPKLLATQPGAA